MVKMANSTQVFALYRQKARWAVMGLQESWTLSTKPLETIIISYDGISLNICEIHKSASSHDTLFLKILENVFSDVFPTSYTDR